MASIQETQQEALDIVCQYYHSLIVRPHYVFEYFNFLSKMTRIDGDSITEVDSYMGIHSLILSLDFIGFDLRNIRCRDVWADGYVVVVNGSVASRRFHGERKFGQTLFFASQDDCTYIRNDIFMYLREEPSEPSHDGAPSPDCTAYRFMIPDVEPR